VFYGGRRASAAVQDVKLAYLSITPDRHQYFLEILLAQEQAGEAKKLLVNVERHVFYLTRQVLDA